MKTYIRVLVYILLFGFVFFVGYQIGTKNTPQKAVKDRAMYLVKKGHNELAMDEIELGARELQLVIDTVELNAYKASLYKELAKQYFFRDMYQKALEYCSKALNYFTSDATLYFIGGASLYQISRVTEGEKKSSYISSAEKNLEIAIKLKSDYPDARYIYALIKLENSEFSEALSHVNYILRSEPNNVEFLFLRARIYYEMGELLDARDDYTKILEILPPNSSRINKVKENIKIIDIEIGD